MVIDMTLTLTIIMKDVNVGEIQSPISSQIKQPAVIHSGMARKHIESFFAPAPRRTATVVQGKLALPGSWHMPRLHDTWRRGLCLTITCMHCCTEGLTLQCPSLSDELHKNYHYVCAIHTISCG